MSSNVLTIATAVATLSTPLPVDEDDDENNDDDDDDDDDDDITFIDDLFSPAAANIAARVKAAAPVDDVKARTS